ncbi:MAG: SsrA-binding protein SmpB [Cyanobacteria bacterium]|jgi:SsrA-binding protein|nr:SsrA-binding protein SmpB [Cyanobacteriota bacterium]
MTTKSTSKEKHSRSIASNKKAYHEYHVLETFKAGIVLTGTEIKSIRLGKVSMNDGFARLEKGEIFLYGLHINPYDKGTHYNHAPDRTRKLLLTKVEIRRLIGKTKESGLTLIPLKMYFDRCWVKVDIGLCKGKKLYDKRDAIKERDSKREIERTMKSDRS